MGKLLERRLWTQSCVARSSGNISCGRHRSVAGPLCGCAWPSRYGEEYKGGWICIGCRVEQQLPWTGRAGPTSWRKSGGWTQTCYPSGHTPPRCPGGLPPDQLIQESGGRVGRLFWGDSQEAQLGERVNGGYRIKLSSVSAIHLLDTTFTSTWTRWTG